MPGHCDRAAYRQGRDRSVGRQCSRFSPDLVIRGRLIPSHASPEMTNFYAHLHDTAGAGAASSRSYAPATGFVSCALFENRRAVLRESALRAGAILGLLELQCLAEVVRGAGVVTAEGEGVERPVERVEGIGAERPAEAGTVRRAHERVTEDLGLPACVRDGRPRIGRAAVAEGDALDLERSEPEPTRDVKREAGRLRRAPGHAELSGRGRVVAGVAD